VAQGRAGTEGGVTNTKEESGFGPARMQSLDDFLTNDQYNLEQVRTTLPHFRDLMPAVHTLYSRSLVLVPTGIEPIFGQSLLLVHKAFLCAAATIGRRHPDDAAPITRRAIETVSLAVAAKADSANLSRWQDYERRRARWAARRVGDKPPRLDSKVKYPATLDRLRSYLGILSDAYVHFTPEFAAGHEWRRNKRGEQVFAELPYITLDANRIAAELLLVGSLHLQMIGLFNRECFGRAFDRDEEWVMLGKAAAARLKEVRELRTSFKSGEAAGK